MEVWKPVVGYEGHYEVSDAGGVRSVKRSIVRRLSIDTRGYLDVNLCKDGIKKKHRVHRLVLEAFVGAAPEGADGCHNNGIKADNRATNLRWGTRQENMLDKRDHGSSTAKLARGCYARIRDMAACGVRQCDIAEWFGLSRGFVSLVVIGRRGLQT